MVAVPWRAAEGHCWILLSPSCHSPRGTGAGQWCLTTLPTARQELLLSCCCLLVGVGQSCVVWLDFEALNHCAVACAGGRKGSRAGRVLTRGEIDKLGQDEDIRLEPAAGVSEDSLWWLLLPNTSARAPLSALQGREEALS